METYPGQTDDRVARDDALRLRNVGDPDDPHDRSGEIEMIGRVDARHLRGLSAEQRAVVCSTSLGAAANDVGRNARVESTDGQIIQKEKRRCVADKNIVHAMIHKIAPNTAVTLQFGRDEHFRADAVGRSDQRTVTVTGEMEESREAADGVKLVWVAPLRENALVPRDGLIAGGDVNAGFGVAIRGSGFGARTRILPAFRHTLQYFTVRKVHHASLYLR